MSKICRQYVPQEWSWITNSLTIPDLVLEVLCFVEHDFLWDMNLYLIWWYLVSVMSLFYSQIWRCILFDTLRYKHNALWAFLMVEDHTVPFSNQCLCRVIYCRELSHWHSYIYVNFFLFQATRLRKTMTWHLWSVYWEISVQLFRPPTDMTKCHKRQKSVTGLI